MGEQSNVSSKTCVSNKNLQNRIPEIHFSNSNVWKSYKLKEFLSFYSTNSLSRSNLNYENGNIKNIHYGDIHTKFPSIINCETEEIPYINLDIDSSRIKEDSFCKDSDLIIADASENYDDIGKAIELINVGNQKIVAGLHTILARDTEDITVSGFKGYLFQTDNLKKQIKIITNGISVLGISKNNLKNLYVNIPSKEEQEKIVRFLFLIDRKIDLLEKTLVLYQRYKTYFLDTLINKNNSPLEKMSNIIRITSSKNKNNENLLVLSINNKLGFISQNDQFDNHKVASEDTSNYKIVEKDDFAYNPARINVGSIARLRNYNKGIVSPMYIVFKIDKDKVNLNYFENYIDSYDFRLNVLKRLEGSVRLVLSAEALKNIMIPLPNLNEQEKIGNFLEYNNKRIQLTNKKLEELKEYKKGLLQKMFC